VDVGVFFFVVVTFVVVAFTAVADTAAVEAAVVVVVVMVEVAEATPVPANTIEEAVEEIEESDNLSSILEIRLSSSFSRFLLEVEVIPSLATA
jgi:hypothetical protein